MGLSRRSAGVVILIAICATAQKSAPPPPLPPDAKTPDTAVAPSKPGLRAALPRCLDAVFHSCWMSPRPAPPSSAEEKAFHEDREVADLYFKQHNYRGAESRYREALALEPGDSKTVFSYAETLNKLHRQAEAREAYSAYLEGSPHGAYASRAKMGIGEAEVSDMRLNSKGCEKFDFRIEPYVAGGYLLTIRLSGNGRSNIIGAGVWPTLEKAKSIAEATAARLVLGARVRWSEGAHI